LIELIRIGFFLVGFLDLVLQITLFHGVSQLLRVHVRLMSLSLKKTPKNQMRKHTKTIDLRLKTLRTGMEPNLASALSGPKERKKKHLRFFLFSVFSRITSAKMSSLIFSMLSSFANIARPVFLFNSTSILQSKSEKTNP
jgi:hypothetical protein